MNLHSHLYPALLEGKKNEAFIILALIVISNSMKITKGHYRTENFLCEIYRQKKTFPEWLIVCKCNDLLKEFQVFNGHLKRTVSSDRYCKYSEVRYTVMSYSYTMKELVSRTSKLVFGAAIPPYLRTRRIKMLVDDQYSYVYRIDKKRKNRIDKKKRLPRLNFNEEDDYLAYDDYVQHSVYEGDEQDSDYDVKGEENINGFKKDEEKGKNEEERVVRDDNGKNEEEMPSNQKMKQSCVQIETEASQSKFIQNPPELDLTSVGSIDTDIAADVDIDLANITDILEKLKSEKGVESEFSIIDDEDWSNIDDTKSVKGSTSWDIISDFASVQSLDTTEPFSYKDAILMTRGMKEEKLIIRDGKSDLDKKKLVGQRNEEELKRASEQKKDDYNHSFDPIFLRDGQKNTRGKGSTRFRSRS